MSELSVKLLRFKGRENLRVALVSCPTPALLDKNGEPYSPVRTNYFPHAQVLLSSNLKHSMQDFGINGEARIVDLKSIPIPEDWRSSLQEYGELAYGSKTLTKFFVGDGFNRLGTLACSDIVGITANFTSEANSVRETLLRVRHINPNALIFVGGRDAYPRRDFYFRAGADLVALGDNDISFPDFVCNLVRDPDKSLRRLAGGNILLPERSKSLRPIDLTVLDDLERYKESGGGGFFGDYDARPVAAYIETSRGCDRDCDFCTEESTKRVNFDLEQIKLQILNYKKHGIGVVLFSDDNLLEWLNLGAKGEEALIELFNFLMEQEMTWEFSVGLELGRLRDKGGRLRQRLIDAMFWNNGNPERWQGAFRLLAPFENIGDKFQLYKKLRPWEETLDTLAKICSMSLPQINLGVMFGWPVDTHLTLDSLISRVMQAAELVRDNSISGNVITGLNLSLFCLMPLPGTPLYSQMEREGRIKYSIEKDPELWNVFTSVIQGDTFTPERITEIRKQLLSEFGSSQPNGKVLSQWRLRN